MNDKLQLEAFGRFVKLHAELDIGWMLHELETLRAEITRIKTELTAVENDNRVLIATVDEQKTRMSELSDILAHRGIEAVIPFDAPETQKMDAEGNVWEQGRLVE